MRGESGQGHVDGRGPAPGAAFPALDPPVSTSAVASGYGSRERPLCYLLPPHDVHLFNDQHGPRHVGQALCEVLSGCNLARPM